MLRFSLALVLASSWAVAPVVAQTAPASHRLLFAPTARAIPSGQWRLGVTEFVIPTAGVGLGRGVSLGAGVIAPPLPGTGGMVFVEPKVSLVDRDGFAFAVGMTGSVNPRDDLNAYAVPYAVATVGSAAAPGHLAATLGVGARVDLQTVYSREWIYDPLADEGRHASEGRKARLAPGPVAFAGLEVRATRRLSLVLEAGALPDRNRSGDVIWGWCATGLTEDWTPPSAETRRYTTTGGAALRYATSRVAVDVGAIVMDDRAYDPEIGPWVNVTLGLGD